MSTALPMANARIVRITAPGFAPDSDQPATAGTDKWAGSADCFVSEKLLTSTATGRLDLLKRTTVIIPGDLRPSVAIAQGDTVSYEYAGQTFTRRVRDFQAHLLAGVEPTVRLDVEDA